MFWRMRGPVELTDAESKDADELQSPNNQVMAGRLKWVDEVERDGRLFKQIPGYSPPPSCLRSLGSSEFRPLIGQSNEHSSKESADAKSEDVDDQTARELQTLCLNEFGFNLRDLEDRLRLISEDLQSSLHTFCADIARSHDAARRRDLAKSFMERIARITQLATDKSISTLVTMHSTFLESMQKENDLLRNKLARSEDDAANFRQNSELEKEIILAETRERCEEEKAILEVSLREELRACRICEVNPRDVVIMPCFHGQYCAKCLEGHQKTNNTCPSCRGIIRGTMPYIA